MSTDTPSKPLEPGYEADLWRLYEELYVHRTDARGPSIAVDGAIEVIRAWRQRGQPAETALRAWHQAFGTSQLTHAIARLERAEEKAFQSETAQTNAAPDAGQDFGSTHSPAAPVAAPSDKKSLLDFITEAFVSTPQLANSERHDAYNEIKAVLSATAPIAKEQRARGLTPEMVTEHYPKTQHQPDECELCHFVFEIAVEALGAVDSRRENEQSKKAHRR